MDTPPGPPLTLSPDLVAAGVSLRLQQPSDLDFLRRLFRAVRGADFAALGWPAAALDAFLDSQFDMQRTQYAAAYPAGEFMVVELGGAPAGRFYVDRGGVTTLVEISLWPEHRGQGLGGALIGLLLDDARTRRADRVVLNVTPDNPARRLYRRLGFIETSAPSPFAEAYLEMAVRFS